MGARDAHELVASVVDALDRGELRVARVVDGDVVVNEAAKHAILMWFRVNDMVPVEVGPFEYVDKLPLKRGYRAAGVRVVPGASARWGSYLAPGVVMMPSYVNIGAYVDEIVLVSDDEMRAAARWLWAELCVPAELSGAASVAAVLAGRVPASPAAPVCAIVSGAGTDGMG